MMVIVACKLACPLCEKFTKKDKIQQNTFIEDLLELSNYKKKSSQEAETNRCKQCPKNNNIAKWKCINCKLEFCDDCKYVHLQIPMLKDHQFSTLEEEQSGKIIDKVLFCSVHDNKLIEFNCSSCETLVCSMCFKSDHNGHKIETITEALERLVPQIETTQGKVGGLINIKEAQIEAINKTIEQTKEIYSSCRLELDERLETLINNLKAMKAQMEDEVTEQETIALDILENIKHNLENQLSEAKHLTNLVNVTMENAKHTSLLDEMQKGLYYKVNECGEQEQMAEEFNIKTPGFGDDQNLEMKIDELKEFIGELYYTEPLWAITTSGLIWTDDEFICDDLPETMDKSYVEVMEIDLPNVTWCNRMNFINHQIWLPCQADENVSADECIRIYNKTGQHVKTVNTNTKGINVLMKANNGDIIAGGNKLYVTDMQCSMWNEIADGCFTDIYIHGNKIAALDSATPAIKILKFTKTKWEEISVFELNSETICSNSTLSIQNHHAAITSTIGKMIYVIDYCGNTVNNFQTDNMEYFLCGHDKNGKVLAVCFSTGKLYIIDGIDKLTKLTLQSKEMKLHCAEIRDMAIDSQLNLWALAGNDTFKLIKYSNP